MVNRMLNAMAKVQFPKRALLSLLLLTLAIAPLSAVTVDEMINDPKLTPQRFAAHFADFKFQFGAEVQDPDVFLVTRAGDCDDFATLAARVFTAKGYTTRLITVRMEQETHVVCYIKEIGGYLDYNNRKYLSRVESSDGSLEAVARKVASSFGTGWVSASEFTFEDGLKLVSRTVTARKFSPVFAQIQ